MSDSYDRRYDRRVLDDATARVRADADRAADRARERAREESRRLDHERERARAAARAPGTTASTWPGPGRTPGGSTTWSRSVGAATGWGGGSAPSAPTRSGAPGGAGCPSPEVVLVGGWDGAGHVHRHPELPGLAVESSPGSMRGELRLALQWPGRLPGRTFVEVGDLAAAWARLEVAGVVLPVEARRLDHRTVVLRWLEPASATTSAGPGDAGVLAASALSTVAGAAWAAWQRRHARPER